jgi:hypothetical protein
LIAAVSVALWPSCQRYPTPGQRALHGSTVHPFTPEFAKAVGLSDDVLTKIANERRSKVTFEIEPLGQMVRLTVVHDDFKPESTVRQMVSEGWPRLLSDLKTLLETGEALPARPARPASRDTA